MNEKWNIFDKSRIHFELTGLIAKKQRQKHKNADDPCAIAKQK